MFSKKDCVNLRLESVLLHHIFRMRTAIYCVWNHTSLKTSTWCLLSGLGTRLKGLFLQGWVERRAFGLHVWCLLGLAVAAEGVQPMNPTSPVVARELKQLEVKGSHRLQELTDGKLVSALPLLQRDGQQSLLQAHCECSGGSEPSEHYQRLILVITLGAGH